ncbi:MAG: hypothetical protein ACOZBH_05110 [Patescibacteria group bacterium]
MEDIKKQIKNSPELAIIFLDLHLISWLSLACFFVLEKKWPGLISYFVHPIILLIAWLITVLLISENFSERHRRFHWIPIILILIAGTIYIKISLQNWWYLGVAVLPVLLLALKKEKRV